MCYLNGRPERFLIIVTLAMIKSAIANEPKQMKKEAESCSSWFPFMSVCCGLFFLAVCERVGEGHAAVKTANFSGSLNCIQMWRNQLILVRTVLYVFYPPACRQTANRPLLMSLTTQQREYTHIEGPYCCFCMLQHTNCNYFTSHTTILEFPMTSKATFITTDEWAYQAFALMWLNMWTCWTLCLVTFRHWNYQRHIDGIWEKALKKNLWVSQVGVKSLQVNFHITMTITDTNGFLDSSVLFNRMICSLHKLTMI